MNRNDINRLFTEKVMEYIAQGYLMHVNTMGGSQGEIAKVDLYKGDEVLRVMLTRDVRFSDELDYDGFLTIVVGRYTDKLWGRWDDTLWNQRLEIIYEQRYAKITDSFFVMPEEGAQMARVRHQRWRRKHAAEFAQAKKPSSAVLQIALRMVRKMPRMKGCQLKDITKVTRVNKGARGQGGAMAGYNIEAKGKTFFFPVK